MTGGGLGEVLAERAAETPHAPFIRVAGGPWVSYGDLDTRANRLAHGLSGLGVAKGDRVAVLCPNRHEMVELIFACARLGAIEVPLNLFLRGEFLHYQLADSSPAVVVTDADGLPAVLAAVRSDAARIVLLDDDRPRAAGSGRGLPYHALLSPETQPPAVEIRARDPLSIMYTSGSTGQPKGCVLPHGYFTENARVIGGAGWLVPGDRLFSAFPLFHSGGQLLTVASPLVNGASICLQAEFHASSFMRDARAENATVVWGLGVMGSAILAQPTRPDDASASLRLAVWSPMDAARQREFEARFGAPVWSEIYGQTEAQPIGLAAATRPDSRRGTQGQVSPLYDVRIVDEHDQEVPSQSVGEIVARPKKPDIMFAGYWGQPAATLATRSNLWHHTGDLGRIDPDGWITVIGRKRDTLRRRGENIAAVELEAAISSHPSIARAAVVGTPSKLGDDDIRALLVLEPGAKLDPVQLFTFLRDRVPYFAIPRYVEIRDSLPQSANGSVMKGALRSEGLQPGAWDLEELGLTVAAAERRRSA